MKDILKKKQNAELRTIAKELGFTGLTKLSKPQLIDIILTKPKQAKKIIDPNFWDRHKNKTPYLGILIALFFGIRGCQNDDKSVISNLEKPSPIEKPFEDEIGTFNILILSFDPTKDCKIESQKYEKQIRNRIREQTKDVQKIKIEYLPIDNIPENEKDLLTIAKENEASLIIWGDFIEECSEATKIRVNYLVTSDLFISEQNKALISNYLELPNVEDLESQTFQLELDNLINWILVLDYFDKDLNKAAELIDKVEFPEKCNYQLLYFKSLIYKNQLDYEKALLNINSILSCKDYIIPEFYKTKAEIFLKQGIKYDSVEYYLTKTIELDSSYFDAYIDKFYAIIQLSEFGAQVEGTGDSIFKITLEYPFCIDGYFRTKEPKISKDRFLRAEQWFHYTRVKMMNEIDLSDLQVDYMNYAIIKHEAIRLLQMAGDLLQIQKEFQEAVKMYNNAISLCEKGDKRSEFQKHQILVSKAVCLYHIKNQPALIQTVNEAIRINPLSFSRVLADPEMEFGIKE